MQADHYAIAIGSNRRHGRHGAPRAVIGAAVDALAGAGLIVHGVSPVMVSPAMGPGGRSYANAAVLIETPLDPQALLALLKGIERAFGRRRGRRWGARVLDLDIALWSGGAWPPGGARRGERSQRRGWLLVPHIGLRHRDFVLRPLLVLAPRWKTDTGQGTVRHAMARLKTRNRRPKVS
jgi:2-amino-4-hydroxy-6-hydroxymethyldihydropteridine diphosphokinase